MHWRYAVHGVGLAAAPLGIFLLIPVVVLWWPALLTVLTNYAAGSAVRGTWLESHNSFQIRTFWYATVGLFGALWMSWGGGWDELGILVSVFFAVGLWSAYRVITGWLRLRDHGPIL
jgi:uncharacterized membrane protein